MKSFFVLKLLLVALALGAMSTQILASDSIPSRQFKLKIGGVLRFNYKYDPEHRVRSKHGGELSYDVFRLNVSGDYGKFSLRSDYRFYAENSGGLMLRYGWLGYRPSEKHFWQFGLVPSPFGLPSASNSFWMNLNYYAGLEDDSDMGVRYTYQHNGWMLSGAFYKNAEIYSSKATTANRYAYDLGGRHKELNQLNLYIHKQWDSNALSHQVGLSGMIGGLHNIETSELGRRYALAAHYIARIGGFAFKGQYSYYDTQAKHEGQMLESVPMVAFGGDHQLASCGSIYTACLSYTLGVRSSWLDELHFYNDVTYLQKYHGGQSDSWQNVSGCMLTAGPIITYVEWIHGRNIPYVGRNTLDALGKGSGLGSSSGMLRVNIGYYF